MRLIHGSGEPVCCSVYRQPPAAFNPRPRYIDFQAQYDGPVVKDPERPDDPGVYIENIVICEHCLRGAAEILGFEPVEQLKREKEAWKAYGEQLEDEIADKDKAISNCHYTIGVLLKRGAKRKPGPPVIVGAEEDADDLRQLRSETQGKNRKKKAAAAK